MRLKTKIEAFSKLVPLKKDFSSEEDNEMVKQLEVKMAQQKNVNDDLKLKLLEKDKQISDMVEKRKMVDSLSEEVNRNTEELDM